jgi:hypothetical protein
LPAAGLRPASGSPPIFNNLRWVFDRAAGLQTRPGRASRGQQACPAADVLGPWQHPDAASCLITIALARSQSGGEGSSALIDEAFRLMEGAALLGPVEKARMRECETARIRESPADVLAVA